VVRKTAHEKTRELALAAVEAWASSLDVNVPVMGAGSLASTATTGASFGWKASAAGP
jgi:hypothetical protein